MEDKEKQRGADNNPQARYTGQELLLLAEQYIMECRNGSDVAKDVTRLSGEEKDADFDCDGLSPGSGGSKRSRSGESRRVPSKKRGSRADGENVRFPNVAGFCRYLGIGTDGYAELAREYRCETGQISAAFEDEALNSDMSATLLGAYLKHRLGYDGAVCAKHDNEERGEVRIVFEHDIYEDGE